MALRMVVGSGPADGVPAGGGPAGDDLGGTLVRMVAAVVSSSKGGVVQGPSGGLGGPPVACGGLWWPCVDKVIQDTIVEGHNEGPGDLRPATSTSTASKGQRFSWKMVGGQAKA